MNNFTIALRRFFQNKNTVTVIGVILILVVLFVGYKLQIKKAVDPVTGIPVATQTIQPRTLIENDMVSTIEVAPIVLSDNVIQLVVHPLRVKQSSLLSPLNLTFAP